MKTRIVHAGFPSEQAAQAASVQLIRFGFTPEHVSAFASSARAGQSPGNVQELDSAVDGIAREQQADPTAAPDAGIGAVKGAAGGTAAGIALGLVAAPFVGPVGMVTGGAIGAYVGSLVGALNQMEQTPETEAEVEQPWPWQVAVATPSAIQQCAAIDVLIAQGGQDLRDAEGQMVAGTWIDFNPHDEHRSLNAESIADLRTRSTETA